MHIMKNPPKKIWLAFGTCKYGQICFPYVKKKTARNFKTIMESETLDKNRPKDSSPTKIRIVEYRKVPMKIKVKCSMHKKCERATLCSHAKKHKKNDLKCGTKCSVHPESRCIHV